MANYDSNYAIAQEISARIGTKPVPFDSVYSICLAIYQELGGTEENFDSVYSILLEILPLATEAANVIDDSIVSTVKTWSSSKIADELSIAGFDVQIVQSLPVSGDTHTIYFVPESSAMTSGSTDVYDEFMWIDSQWEQVGSTRIDLSDYYTVSEINALLDDKQDVLTAGSGVSIDSANTISVSSEVISGAALGATALQSVPSEYVTDTELSTELADYATTSAMTSGLAAKQDTLTAGSNITISGNTISTEGYVFDNAKGAFAEQYLDDDNNIISTNTATGIGSHAEGWDSTASGDYGSHAEGYQTTANETCSHSEGFKTKASGSYGSHAEGTFTIASGQASHAEGYGGSVYKNVASGNGSHVEGIGTTAQNSSEHAEGSNNLSHKESDTFGNAGNTLHSIGNSDLMNVKYNALEIMQNADMYVKGIGGYQGTNTKVQDNTIKPLQTVISDINTSVAAKQDTLTAGTNITISGTTISATYEVATTADIEALFS